MTTKRTRRAREHVAAAVAAMPATTMPNPFEGINDNRDRAVRIERIVRRDYLDDDCDAADIALGVIEAEPGLTDKQIAARVAATLDNS